MSGSFGSMVDPMALLTAISAIDLNGFFEVRQDSKQLPVIVTVKAPVQVPVPISLPLPVQVPVPIPVPVPVPIPVSISGLVSTSNVTKYQF